MKKYFLIFAIVFCFNVFYTNEVYTQETPTITHETIKAGNKTLKYREERIDNYSKRTITIPSSSLDEAYDILKEYYDTNNRQDVYYNIGRLIEIFGQLNPVINNNDVIDMAMATIFMHKSSDTKLVFDMQDSETGALWSYTMDHQGNETILTIVWSD